MALKHEIQVNKYTTDTGYTTLATLLYAFFENIDFNIILCTKDVTKDVLK